jgi:thiosulfate/3-mercaptopyruvate sulfurtransferase
MLNEASFSMPCENQMNRTFGSRKFSLAVLALSTLFVCAAFAYQASLIPSSRLISPEELAKILRSSEAEKPLMIQVGFRVLYSQAHIPNSEYIGPASSEDGLQRLRKRVEPLPRNRFIVLYCGCCPWNHCPNIKPADDALQALGFKNVKVLYVANNFGADWVDKGYPSTKSD